VTAEDRGPGFANPDEALRGDGEKSASFARPGPKRGLGQGLGVVGRLMDEVRAENRRGGGACVTARKWLPEAKR